MRCVKNLYAIPKCVDVTGVVISSVFMATFAGLRMMTCPKCEHVTFGKHKEPYCQHLSYNMAMYTY